ncbi:MAG: 30S ribosomal protein S27ae [Candidatus Aenigmarchaeota archaeon]|nr:30S ribosomal protein S27ae [Candidatus Aenigmarchaeota archaeon]
MAKKEKKNPSKSKHKLVKKSSFYKVEGEKVVRSREFCPKCGPGVFMGKRKLADGKIRHYCGKCFMTIEKKE